MKSLTIFGLMIVGVFAFTATTSQAQPVEVSVVSVDDLAFGKLSAPSDFADVWTLRSSDGALLHTGSGNSMDLIAGDHNRGSFDIFGDPNSSVTYSVAVTTPFSDLGLLLSMLNPSTDPVSPSTLDGAGFLHVYVGGNLTIGVLANTGLHNDAVITITVNYE